MGRVRKSYTPPMFNRLLFTRAIARYPVRVVLVGIAFLFTLWIGNTTLALSKAAHQPVDAFLVLGGSIRREVYAAELAKQHPNLPVLISQGSPDPCIRLIFERAGAPLSQTWLEKCAKSTFENFFYCTPLLQRWQIHKVKLITSNSHLPRALWLGQILLGAHRIWVEPILVSEMGIPGNRESWWKTGLDVVRSLGWAIASQIYQPDCPSLLLLSDVDLVSWRQQGFHCEHQANL